jgi:hypothetical protein
MKLRLIFLTVLVLALASSLSFAGTPDSTAFVVITFSNTGFPTYVDTFGIGVRYTLCIDKSSTLPHAETEQPPSPPPGNTDARFVDFSGTDPDANCHGAGLKTDIQTGSLDVAVADTFQYQIQVADKNFPWFITWDTTNIHKKLDSLVIVDASSDGIVYHLDMFTTDSIKITKTTGPKGVDKFFIYAFWKPIHILGVVERQHGLGIPTQFALNQNYPNPFNPTTTLSFSLVKSAFTEVAVYNILGQKVASLVGEQLAPGTYTTKWNGTDDRGLSVSSGVYFVRMNANFDAAANFTAMRKILLMK